MTFAKSLLSIFEADNNRNTSVIDIKLDLNKKITFHLKFTVTDKIAVLFFVFLLGGCKKEQSILNSRILSRTIKLEVHSIHHTWDVSGISIYLKKNATDFPGKDTSLYEFKGITDGYGKYTFEKLFPGDYYLYVSGFDSIS